MGRALTQSHPILALTAALLACGCGPATPRTVMPRTAANVASNNAASPICPLVDRAQDLGVDFAYRNGSEAEHCTILESLGGGVGWTDMDRDGWLDLVVTGGGNFAQGDQINGLPLGLFRSIDGRKFSPVAAKAGMESPRLYTNGLTFGDFDNDGFQDILVTGYGVPDLWHNRGDGTFQVVSGEARIADSRWGSSAGWADLNQDGNLDLYIAHYVNWSFENHPYCAGPGQNIREICPPRSYQPVPHVVYFSQGDGTFVDASSTAGLRPDGKGLGVLLCDVEPDGDVDIYVANDTTDNFLYVNQGAGTFQEQGLQRGVALDDHGIPNGSMGVDVCDFNQDGLPDLWVANYEQEAFALYRNEGNANFLHVSQRLGITDLRGLFVGFGTACEDFDSDGDQDFVVANGHVIKYPVVSPRRQLPLLLTYDGRRYSRARFAEESYFEEPHEGRGLATADFDADGDLDIAISHLNEPLALLVNEFHSAHHSLSLELIGTRSNRDAVGARVELQTSLGKTTRQVTGGGSYQSHSSRRLHFVLPQDDGPRSLVVHWPCGEIQNLDVSSLAGQVALIEPLAPGESLPRLVVREVRR
jgi:hypothetical protein